MEIVGIRNVNFDDTNNVVYCTFKINEKNILGNYKTARVKLTLKEFQKVLRTNKLEALV